MDFTTIGMERSLSPVKVASYDCVIIGDSGVGKTKFLLHHGGGELSVPTVGVEKTTIIFNTQIGELEFSLLAATANDKYIFRREQLYERAHAVIIMFDINAPKTYNSVRKWIREVMRISRYVPIVVVGNKVDVRALTRKVRPAKPTLIIAQQHWPYVEMAVSTAFNTAFPFLIFARDLVQMPHLTFMSPLEFEEADTTQYSEDQKSFEKNLKEFTSYDSDSDSGVSDL